MELLQCDDFKPFTPQPINTTINNVKRSSVINPPTQFEDKLTELNDNFELIETFINENFSTFNNNNEKNLQLNNHRKYSDDLSSIDPKLINDHDDLSIPEHFNNDFTDPFSLQYDKNISAFEPIVPKTEIINDLKRSVSLMNETVVDFEGASRLQKPKSTLAKVNSFRRKTPIKSGSVNSSNSTGKGGVAAAAAAGGDKSKQKALMKRSLSVADPVGKPRSFKNREEVHEYFNGREKSAAKNGRASPEKEVSLFELEIVKRMFFSFKLRQSKRLLQNSLKCEKHFFGNFIFKNLEK